MSKFVEHANLPRNAEKLIIGERYRDQLDKSLKSLKIEPIYCPSNPCIDERLSGHCDLNILHTGGNSIYAAPYLKDSAFSAEIEKLGIKVFYPEIKMAKNYPKDSQLNLCLLKNNFFCSPKVSSESIVYYLTDSGMKALSVKQGYCRCSVCIVNDSSIITSDTIVYRKALVNDVDCLLIKPGYIALTGYDYGFIGGSSFKISENVICFTGSLDAHPDKESIFGFLNKHCVSPVFLTDQPIFDIGSAVPLTEK